MTAFITEVTSHECSTPQFVRLTTTNELAFTYAMSDAITIIKEHEGCNVTVTADAIFVINREGIEIERYSIKEVQIYAAAPNLPSV